MKLFKKKQEKRNPVYESNVTVSQMKFSEHFDQKIALIVKDQEPVIQGAVYISLTSEATTQAMEELKHTYPESEITCMESVIGLSLDYVLQGQQVLIMYGFTPMPLLITKEDLEPIRDIVDSFCIMYACARNRIPVEQAYEFMKEKHLYYIGEPLTPKSKTFGVEVIDREDSSGQHYRSIKLFLTKESANRYNKENRVISKVVLKDMLALWKGTYGLIIEPHENYWIEFGKEFLT